MLFDEATSFGYVPDPDNHRIQKFTSVGLFVQQVGEEVGGPGQFKNPMVITQDADQLNYVVDTDNHRARRLPNICCSLANGTPRAVGKVSSARLPG